MLCCYQITSILFGILISLESMIFSYIQLSLESIKLCTALTGVNSVIYSSSWSQFSYIQLSLESMVMLGDRQHIYIYLHNLPQGGALPVALARTRALQCWLCYRYAIATTIVINSLVLKNDLKLNFTTAVQSEALLILNKSTIASPCTVDQ